LGYAIYDRRYLESTDDAMSKPIHDHRAESFRLHRRSAGSDNEPVKDGQLLARIDDRDFKTALNQAKADVAASEAACAISCQIELQEPLISSRRPRWDAAEANLKFAPRSRPATTVS